MCKPGRRGGGGQVWRICCHVDLTETKGRGGEQADNGCSVSAQQQVRAASEQLASVKPLTTQTRCGREKMHRGAAGPLTALHCACPGLAFLCGVQGLVAEKQQQLPSSLPLSLSTPPPSALTLPERVAFGFIQSRPRPHAANRAVRVRALV